MNNDVEKTTTERPGSAGVQVLATVFSVLIVIKYTALHGFTVGGRVNSVVP